MDLKEFIKQVLSDTVEAVDESSANAAREIELTYRTDKRTIEFDVAVSAEETTTKEGKAGVKVLSFMEAGADLGIQSKNSTVSRIMFGVDVSRSTKQEQAQQEAEYRATRSNRVNEGR